MSIEYQVIDKAWVINTTKDTVGRLNPTAVLIKVSTLSPGEIEALPEGCVVPKAWKTIYSVNKTLRGEIITQIFLIFTAESWKRGRIIYDYCLKGISKLTLLFFVNFTDL